jgi:hypothetical protein
MITACDPGPQRPVAADTDLLVTVAVAARANTDAEPAKSRAALHVNPSHPSESLPAEAYRPSVTGHSGTLGHVSLLPPRVG